MKSFTSMNHLTLNNLCVDLVLFMLAIYKPFAELAF